MAHLSLTGGLETALKLSIYLQEECNLKHEIHYSWHMIPKTNNNKFRIIIKDPTSDSTIRNAAVMFTLGMI